MLDPIVSGPLAQMGVAGIFVLAGIYAVKWLVSKLDEKDTRIKQVTDEYLAAMKGMIDKSEQNGAVMAKALADNTSAMDELRDAVRQIAAPVTGPRASDTLGARRHT